MSTQTITKWTIDSIRTDFGLTFNAALETGGVVLGENIKLQIDAQLVKQA
jgi:hypothetical protein